MSCPHSRGCLDRPVCAPGGHVNDNRREDFGDVGDNRHDDFDDADDNRHRDFDNYGEKNVEGLNMLFNSSFITIEIVVCDHFRDNHNKFD